MTLLTLDHMRLTLGLTMSPRTVGRYFRTLGPPARRAAVPAVRDVCAESCARGPREVVPRGPPLKLEMAQRIWSTEDRTASRTSTRPHRARRPR
jgi:hypothetical protein